MFAFVGAASAVLFIALTYAFFAQPGLADRYALFAACWWLSGIAALGCAVAACHEDEDPSEDPHYLSSIVAGLREEWRRP